MVGYERHIIYRNGALQMSVQHVYEITVIGGGPVGMFAAFYAGLRSTEDSADAF